MVEIIFFQNGNDCLACMETLVVVGGSVVASVVVSFVVSTVVSVVGASLVTVVASLVAVVVGSLVVSFCFRFH